MVTIFKIIDNIKLLKYLDLMEFLKTKTLSYIPFNFYLSNNENTNKEQSFKSGIIRDRFNDFNEHRKNHQSRFFHYLEKDIFNDSVKLLDDLDIFGDSKKTHLISKKNNIELQPINSNNDNNKYNSFLEIYLNTKYIYEELINDFSFLERKQEERIKTKIYESENKKIDKEIKKIINSMTEKVKTCEKNIKNLSSFEIKLSPQEMNIKENIKINLAEKIQKFSINFRNNEKNFREKLKKLGVSSSIIDDDEKENNDLNADNILPNDFFSKYDDNSELKRRDKDINVMVSSLNELSIIFKDLQNIVQQQGTILDRIDYNIDIAAANSKNAQKHLVKAEEEQHKSCFRNVTLLLLVIIFIEVIAVIIKYL